MFIVELARLYAESARFAGLAAAKNLLLLVIFVAYFLAYDLALWVLGAVLGGNVVSGFAGGIVLSLLRGALAGSALALLEQAVLGGGRGVLGPTPGRVRIDDVQGSFGRYLWEVIGVFFVVWIASMLVGSMFGASPDRGVFMLMFSVLLFVFLNVVPELIYQGHSGSLQLVAASARFISAHWIEWFVPNALAGGAVVASYQLGLTLPAGPIDLVDLGRAFVLFFLMLFRGYLFWALGTWNPRQARVRRLRGG